MSVGVPGVGQTLRHERELRGISMEEIARTTRIPMHTLRSMESDAWGDLPGDVFARGFLRSYAQALGLDPRPLLARYDALCEESDEEMSAMPAVAPQERGRRFGIAIALVVLLVLFTLALSIVLRPRRRDVPVELSQTTAPVVDFDVA